MISFPLFNKVPGLVYAITTKLPSSHQTVKAGQVHGSKIAWVNKADAGRTIPATDGLITQDRGLFLLIRTADCLPVFICHPDQKVVGLLHAGLKGVNLNIHLKALKLLKHKLNLNPKDLLIGLGPCVCQSCYHRHFDLKAAVTKDLLQAGIVKPNLNSLDICTCEDTQLPSHQRSYRTGEPEGKLYNIIGFKA